MGTSIFAALWITCGYAAARLYWSDWNKSVLSSDDNGPVNFFFFMLCIALAGPVALAGAMAWKAVRWFIDNF